MSSQSSTQYTLSARNTTLITNFTNLTEQSVDDIKNCVSTDFTSDDDYLKNCCSGNEPYIKEYIKKRCEELFTM